MRDCLPLPLRPGAAILGEKVQVNETAAEKARATGLAVVVMDRCIYKDCIGLFNA